MKLGRRGALLIFAVLPAAVAAAIVGTLSVWRDVADRALSNPEDSHILLALPVAFWLGWLRRGRLRHWRPEPSFLGPGMIACGWVLITLGYQWYFDALMHMGALLAVLGAVTAVVGPRLLFKLKPSLLALIFLFPFPGRFREVVAIPLQQASAFITEHTLQLFGHDVIRNGIVLELEGHQVAVAEACNGMRMVTALALIAYAFAFSIPMRRWVRLALLFSSPLVALIVNVARLVPTTLLYGYASEQSADMFHDISGWASIGLAIGVLWAGLSLLRWLEVPIDPFPVRRTAA
jgi:exosortase